MLILTSAACRAPRDLGLPSAWPGPAVFVARPGHGLSGSALRAIEADAVVVEALEPLPGGLGLLAEIVRRLPWLLRTVEPLVLLDAPAAPGILGRERARGVARPRQVTPRWGAEGGLEGLLLGEAVAGHPLAGPVLSEAAERGLPDRLVLDLLAAALGGEPASDGGAAARPAPAPSAHPSPRPPAAERARA